VDAEVNQRFKSDQRLIDLLSTGPIPGCLDAVWCDVTDAARRIRVPFAVIHGQEDQLDLPHEGELLYELLSGEKELHLVEGSGHAGHLDQKRDEIFELMAKWFESHLT
ncbi:MAG: alpha/beta hydrolase, partial [Chloroflexota bacterium]|nr:alpha/beta hydrolase [Chloroflexota bacterium]